MSKKSNDVKDATPAVTPEAPAPVAAAPVVAAAAPAALATVAPLSADPVMAALLAQLPEIHRARASAMTRPTGAEFEQAVAKTSPEQQESLLSLIERMAPNKPGVHLSEEAFAPTIVKVYHGVGNDASRPAKLLPGSFYSSTSRDLSEKMTVAILAFSNGRTLWPEKDAESKNPICSSGDGLNGTKYGSCATCPSMKLMYTQGGCTPQYTFWFIDREATGIYELSFSKTSYSAGKALARIVKDSARPWDRWIELASVAKVNGDKKWYLIQGTPVQDIKVPANEATSPALRGVFGLLNRSLELESYYPRLARQYSRSTDDESAPPAGSNTAGKPLGADVSDGDFGGADTSL